MSADILPIDRKYREAVIALYRYCWLGNKSFTSKLEALRLISYMSNLYLDRVRVVGNPYREENMRFVKAMMDSYCDFSKLEAR